MTNILINIKKKDTCEIIVEGVPHGAIYSCNRTRKMTLFIARAKALDSMELTRGPKIRQKVGENMASEPQVNRCIY